MAPGLRASRARAVREELFGEVEFVVGLVGVEEGDGEGAQGLVVGGLAGFCVLFGFEAPGQVGVGRACQLSLEPPHVSEGPLVTPFPAQGPRGGEGGGEVPGQACGLGQPTVAVGDLLVAPA
ncbi:hypothetical protein [Streptomyces sp. NPDC056169]|uniref:hypothetical protein n=1 Tax=Streptomyces sp. NPDC056169 TaxID=3345734 RepID=UPI0035E26AEA